MFYVSSGTNSYRCDRTLLIMKKLMEISPIRQLRRGYLSLVSIGSSLHQIVGQLELQNSAFALRLATDKQFESVLIDTLVGIDSSIKEVAAATNNVHQPKHSVNDVAVHEL